MARHFDISLIPRVLSRDEIPPIKEAGRGIPSGSDYGASPGRGIDGGSDAPEKGILRAFQFQPDPDQAVHVVELARGANLEFDEALKGILRMVARGDLDLLQRDTVANDHLVSLTRQGEGLLKRVLP